MGGAPSRPPALPVDVCNPVTALCVVPDAPVGLTTASAPTTGLAFVGFASGKAVVFGLPSGSPRPPQRAMAGLAAPGGVDVLATSAAEGVKDFLVDGGDVFAAVGDVCVVRWRFGDGASATDAEQDVFSFDIDHSLRRCPMSTTRLIACEPPGELLAAEPDAEDGKAEDPPPAAGSPTEEAKAEDEAAAPARSQLMAAIFSRGTDVSYWMDVGAEGAFAASLPLDLPRRHQRVLAYDGRLLVVHEILGRPPVDPFRRRLRVILWPPADGVETPQPPAAAGLPDALSIPLPATGMVGRRAVLAGSHLFVALEAVVRVWDLTSVGTPVVVDLPHDAGVVVAMSAVVVASPAPGGVLLGTLSSRGTIRVWHGSRCMSKAQVVATFDLGLPYHLALLSPAAAVFVDDFGVHFAALSEA